MYTRDKLKHMQIGRLVQIANEDFELGVAEGEEKGLLIDAILGAMAAREDGGQTPDPTANIISSGGMQDEDEDEVAIEDPEERILVTLHESSAPDGRFPFKGALNGEAIVVHRSKKVALKRKFLSLLDDAMESRYETEGEGREQRIVERLVPRYTYTVHGPAK